MRQPSNLLRGKPNRSKRTVLIGAGFALLFPVFAAAIELKRESPATALPNAAASPQATSPAATPPTPELLTLPPATQTSAPLPTVEQLLSLPPESVNAPLTPAPTIEDAAPAPVSPPPSPAVEVPVPSAEAAPPSSGQPEASSDPQPRTPETASLPNPLDIVTDTATDGFKPSFGSWPYSIMFPTTEITNLKNILALYERKGFIVEQAATPTEEVAKPTVDDLYKKLQETPLPSGMVYPSFKLRSIMYRGPNEWSVWLNNRMLTNENNKPDNEIVVVNVTKEYAEFAWIPTNAELLSAILQLRLLPEASRPPMSETPKHRKALTSASSGWLDKNTSVVHFVLRPNQAFYAETFEVFEGMPDSLAASMSRAIQLETEPNSSPITPENDPKQIIKDLQEQLGEEGKKTEPAPPPTAEQKAEEMIGEKQSPKAQMMRTLGLGK